MDVPQYIINLLTQPTCFNILLPCIVLAVTSPTTGLLAATRGDNVLVVGGGSVGGGHCDESLLTLSSPPRGGVLSTLGWLSVR